MMKQIKIVEQSSDDLDATVLLQKAVHFFSHYGKLLLAVALGGMLIGLLRFWFSPYTYSSSLVLQPTMLSDPEQIELINNWSMLLKKKEFTGLATQFNTDVSMLKKVKSISAEELQKSYAPNNYTAFSLTVSVTDPAILKPLQKGILHGLNNSEYIKDKLAARKNILSSLIGTVQEQLNRLHNMQSAIESNTQMQDNTGARMIVDVSGISGQIAVLQEKKLNFEENLSFLSSVNVLQNFYIPARPDNPRLLKSLAIGLAGGMMLGAAIAFYLHVRSRMK